jgi:hypothetical protein
LSVRGIQHCLTSYCSNSVVFSDEIISSHLSQHLTPSAPSISPPHLISSKRVPPERPIYTKHPKCPTKQTSQHPHHTDTPTTPAKTTQ